MEPDDNCEDRSLPSPGKVRCEHIEIKAVLLADQVLGLRTHDVDLQGRRGFFRGAIQSSCPWLRRLGQGKPEVSYRRCGVRDGFEGVDYFVLPGFYPAAFDLSQGCQDQRHLQAGM